MRLAPTSHSTCVPNHRHAADARGAAASTPTMISMGNRVILVNLPTLRSASSGPSLGCGCWRTEGPGAADVSACVPTGRQTRGYRARGRYAAEESSLPPAPSEARPSAWHRTCLRTESGGDSEGTTREGDSPVAHSRDALPLGAHHRIPGRDRSTGYAGDSRLAAREPRPRALHRQLRQRPEGHPLHPRDRARERRSRRVAPMHRFTHSLFPTRSALLAVALIGGATSLATSMEALFLAENNAAMAQMMAARGVK